MAGGLLQVEMGNAGVTEPIGPAGREPVVDASVQAKQADAVKDALGSTLYGMFCEWRDARLDKENMWLSVMRSYNGQYDAAKLAEIGQNRSKVFVHLTRTKTMTAYSRIIDLLLGHGNHWDIKPTSEPELDPNMQDKAMSEIAMADPAFEPDHEAVARITKVIADDASTRMKNKINDQLTEANYDRIFKTAVFECCQLGTGCIKGPFISTDTKKSWGSSDNGWQIQTSETINPGIDAPSIWDIYPDPYCTSVDDAIGIFERHVVTAKQFRALKSRPGFNGEAIDDIIATNPNGNHTDYTHEIERRQINGISNTTPTNARYDLLEYWGQVTGHQLAAAGLKIDEAMLSQEFQANVWFCGHRTVRAQLNPLVPERLPYNIFPYERAPFSIWGVGAGEQMTDSQSVLNASIRATLDNLGISSGPQVEVNQSMLQDGEDPRALYPWRVWVRKGGDPTTPMLRFYQPENVSAGLTQIAEIFRRFADEETSMPSYTHGETMPGLNNTATGMSMLMGAANVTLKSIIKNIDTYAVEPMIRGFYDFNMEHSDDDSIKGDMKVEAIGSTSLLAKEVQSQRLIQYAQLTANPIDIQIMGPAKRAGLQRAIAKALDLNPDEVAADDPDKAPQGGQPGMMPGQPGQPGAPMPQPGMNPAQMPSPGNGMGRVNVNG